MELHITASCMQVRQGDLHLGVMVLLVINEAGLDQPSLSLEGITGPVG